MRIVEPLKTALAPEQRYLWPRVLAAANDVGLDPHAIYDKHFKRMPFKLSGPLRRYALGRRRVLDVGSGWGEFLVHFGSNSVGLEISPTQIAFSRALGLDVKEGNLEDRPNVPQAPFEVVWCSNLVEHLVSPHLGLLIIRSYLRPDGLLLASIPVVPRRSQRLFARGLIGFEGYSAEDHVNAFTRETMTFFLERAGFRVVAISTFLPPGARPRILASALDHLYPHLTFVARPMPGRWLSPAKRPPECMPRWMRRWADLYE